MSTNKTPNYDLHSWVPQDDFHMTEINENYTKLDTALKTEAQTAAQGRSALQTALNGKADAAAVTTLSQQLAGKATTAAVNALSQQLAGKASTAAVTALQTAMARSSAFVYGTYAGDMSKNRTIEVGHTINILLLECDWGSRGGAGSIYVAGGLCLPSFPLGESDGSRLSVEGSRFHITITDRDPYMNQSNMNYLYLAWVDLF